MLNNDEFICRICGLIQYDITWDDNNIPSHNICDCCGVECGYEDCSLDNIKQYRNNWLKSYSEWFNKKHKPMDWSLENQLLNIPKKYL